MKDLFSLYKKFYIDLHLTPNPESIAYGRVKAEKVEKKKLRMEQRILNRRFPDLGVIDCTSILFQKKKEEVQEVLLEEQEEEEEESEDDENEKNEDFFAADSLAEQFVYN